QSHGEQSAFDPIVWPSQALNLVSSPAKLVSQDEQNESMLQTENNQQFVSTSGSISSYLTSIFNDANLLTQSISDQNPHGSQPNLDTSELMIAQSVPPDALQFFTETAAALILNDGRSSSGSVNFEQGNSSFNLIPRDQIDSDFSDLTLNADSMVLLDLTHGNPPDANLIESTCDDEPSGASPIDLQFLSTQYDTTLGDSSCTSLMIPTPEMRSTSATLDDEQLGLQENEQFLNTRSDLNSICELTLNLPINSLNSGIDLQHISMDNSKNEQISQVSSDNNGFICNFSRTYRECRDFSKIKPSAKSNKFVKSSKKIRDVTKVSMKTYKVIMDLLSKMPETNYRPKPVTPMKDWVYEPPSYCVNMCDVEFAYLEITKDIERETENYCYTRFEDQGMTHVFNEEPSLDYNQGRFFLSSLNVPEIADIPDFCYTKYMDFGKLAQVDVDTRDLNYIDQGIYNSW
ncbi:12466_t:CDS:1, partial [Acaulospora morrowiae]